MATKSQSSKDPVSLLQEELMRKLPNGHPDFIPRLLEMAKLHNAKNADYAGDGDPLGNFERCAAIKQLYPGFPDATAAGMAINFALKQFDAVLFNMANGTSTSVESMADKFRDIAVYAILTAILLERQQAGS